MHDLEGLLASGRALPTPTCWLLSSKRPYHFATPQLKNHPWLPIPCIQFKPLPASCASEATDYRAHPEQPLQAGGPGCTPTTEPPSPGHPRWASTGLCRSCGCPIKGPHTGGRESDTAVSSCPGSRCGQGQFLLEDLREGPLQAPWGFLVLPAILSAPCPGDASSSSLPPSSHGPHVDVPLPHLAPGGFSSTGGRGPGAQLPPDTPPFPGPQAALRICP